jgi:DNA-binding GntR family transcriptional regulator
MPIREALMVLAGIGVEEMRPNRGAVVRALGPAEVRGIYLVRRALECEAIRAACGRIGAADLRALQVDLSRLITAGGGDRSTSVAEARAVDSRLHDRIAAACGNPFLRDEISRRNDDGEEPGGRASRREGLPESERFARTQRRRTLPS